MQQKDVFPRHFQLFLCEIPYTLTILSILYRKIIANLTHSQTKSDEAKRSVLYSNILKTHSNEIKRNVATCN